MQLNALEFEREIETATKLLVKNKNFKAIKCLNKLLTKNVSNAQAYLLLGIANRRIGKLDEAISYLKKATEKNSSKMEAWGLLTITLIDQGKLEEAKMIIKKAGYLNPYNPKIQFFSNNLVRVYTKFGPFF